MGSGCYSKESYEDGLKQARALFDHEAKAGRKMSILDIGGGFISNDSFDEVFVISLFFSIRIIYIVKNKKS